MRCPAGHESTATDYCDLCGVAMTATPAPVDPSSPPPASAPTDPPTTVPAVAQDCPHCGTANQVDALFCEACGYDFTTGTLPRPLDPPPGATASGSPGAPSSAPAPAAAAGPAAAAAGPAGGNPAPGLDGWVAEVWVDPDWYADQESTDPLPSPGLPLVVALRHTSVLVGRVSRSRNIHPDIDLATDTGISRRHAQLTTDGSRWWVEDLGSSNGTYVASATAELPTASLPVGEKREVGPDDRVYVGAWTRIIVRRAAPGEI